jgi:ketosteroid isomerase-like protein
MDAMSDLWEHSDRVACVHPGWTRLTGWGAISASFFALFQNDQPLQFILTGDRVDIEGDLGWVSVDENILGEDVGGTVAALNLFVRDAGGVWRLLVHHGSSVVPRVG